MNTTEFQLQGVSDPRLAAHATSGLPAWLWSTDGTRVLWANPPGAKFFGAANAAELAKKTFGPADPHRRQAAQLAGRLPASGAVRLERLRGFGARPGMLATCACTQLDFPAGNRAILIVPTETALPVMPLFERLQGLIQGIDLPIAIFAPDGTPVATSEAARGHPAFATFSEAGLDAARASALSEGRSEETSGFGRLVLQRIGAGAEVALVALISPPAFGAAARIAETAGPGVATPPDYEQPGLSGEAPAEFALLDDVSPPPAEPTSAETAAPPAPPSTAVWRDFPIDEPRPHPLRFIWQMDEHARFTLTSDEFLTLAGAPTAARLGRRFAEIADALGLDPQARVMKAFASHDTWSGITLDWPVEDGGSVAVELAGLAVYDRTRRFVGFRGFGVCRDLEALARLAAFRSHQREQPVPAQAPSSDIVAPVSDPARAAPGVTAEADAETDQSPAPPSPEVSPPTDLDKPVETPPPLEIPPNVVPFRPLGGEARMPALTAVENSAFNELARQISARLEREQAAEAASREVTQAAAEPSAPEASEPRREPDTGTQPEWLMPQQPPARGEDKRDRTLLDLLPTGVLIYRLDSLLYANPAFLQRMGYPSLHALEQAGGLDALYVEPGVPSSSSTSEAGTPVMISPSRNAGEGAAPTEAKLFTISWDGDSALALMFVPGEGPAASAAPVQVDAPVEAGHADAEDLAAILDTTAEGIVMFDASGNIHACNRSAGALFGHDGDELAERNLADLFAPESRQVVLDCLAGVQQAGAARDAGRTVLGRVARGGIIPLSMTMGRTRAGGPNFFAVFHDQSQGRQNESELREARRLAERAASAKTDMLARISHEVRTPLNAIIGFAEVMIAERFGPLGNERYAEYLTDIRAAGERVIAVINDLSELSRIETGKLDLAFTSQNLNELVENCVSVMQPQANRERIIIRTSLAHLLPPVVADARSLRQITMNLIGNSIQLANPGGQVIVSTALSDHGNVILRVRDTGHGLNDNEVAAALEPFRTPPPSDKSTDKAELNLSLAKALVEANRAQFHIKTGGRSGTLVEVVFARALARA